MPKNPPVEEDDAVKQADQLMVKLLPILDEKEGFSKVKEMLAAVSKKVDAVAHLEKFDVKSLLESFDRIKSSNEMLAKQIRNDRRSAPAGMMESEGSFNSVKYIIGCRLGHDHPDAKSEKEFEMVKACYSEIEKNYGVKAAQVIGDPTRGASFLPDQVLAEYIAALYHTLVFVQWGAAGSQRLRVFDGLFGAQVRIPKAEGGIVVYTASEEKDATESVANTGEVVFNPKKIHALVKITESMRDFAPAQFNQYLQSEMFNKFGEKLDFLCGYGRGGDNEPLGIFRNPRIGLYSAQAGATVANTAAAIAGANGGDWQGGELTFDVMENVKTALKRAKVTLDSSAAWISAPELFTRLKLSKWQAYNGQTSQLPFLFNQILTDDKLKGLIGEYGETAQISATQKPGATILAPSATGAAKTTDAAYAKWNQGFLARWFGIKLEDDGGKGLGFKSGALYQRMSMTFDVNLGREQAFMLVPDAKATS